MTNSAEPAVGTIADRLDRTQAIAVAIWLAFGGAVLFFGWHLAMFNKRGGPGPGFFLKILAIMLLLLTAVRALTLLREAMLKPAAGAVSPDAAQAGETYRAGQVVRFVLLVLALTLYAYVLTSLGFLVATTALCWAALTMLGRHPARALIEAAVGAFLVRFAFTHGLGVPLPEAHIPLLSSLGL